MTSAPRVGAPVRLTRSGLVALVVGESKATVVDWSRPATYGDIDRLACVCVARIDGHGEYNGCSDYPIRDIDPLPATEIAAHASSWRRLCAKFHLPGLRVRA